MSRAKDRENALLDTKLTDLRGMTGQRRSCLVNEAAPAGGIVGQFSPIDVVWGSTSNYIVSTVKLDYILHVKLFGVAQVLQC